MIISINAKKTLWKYSTSFDDKSSKKLGLEGTYLNIIKAIYDKPIANIILNGEKLKSFPLKSGMRQGCSLSLLLCNIVLKFLTRAICNRNKLKGFK
jgi:hypothetical protein